MNSGRRGRLSKREHVQNINSGHRLFASLIQDPVKRAEYERLFITQLPPKRERVVRPVDGKPVTPSEYQEQGVVIDWWWRAHMTFGLPVFSLFSVPNGAYLASGYAGAAMLKKNGLRPGTPDLVLATPRGQYHGLFIEMKSENGRESDEQKKFGAYLERAGYRFLFSYGSVPAIAAIKEYLGLP